jgi:hypothetical protein
VPKVPKVEKQREGLTVQGSGLRAQGKDFKKNAGYCILDAGEN